MPDCLIIGFNDFGFEGFVEMVRSMGTDSGAYKDLDLTFIEYEGKPVHSMDILNHFYLPTKGEGQKPFHNSDFLWPVVTYLGSYLWRRGYSFDYVNLFQSEKERLKEKLLKEDILTVAITTTLYVSPHPILEVVSFIRQYNKTAKIILGGPYVSNQAKMDDPESLQLLFKYLGADFYVISSEGEASLAGILNALKNGADLNSVDNIAYKDGDGFRVTATSVESNDLEQNMVNYGLFPPDEFAGFVTLRSAKSCPFSCAFCGFPQRAGKYTYLPVNLVEQELDAIKALGTVHTLTFIDDTFNVPKARFKELLRMMIKNKYGFRWNSYLRSDHVDEEALDLMAESGCDGVFLGVESGSDFMLERMNKTSRRKDYLRVIPQLRERGIVSYASLIIGFPGETYETANDTLEFIEEARPDFFRAQLWYCDPTTPIWNERDKYGVKGSAFNWRHDTMDARTACDLVDKFFFSVRNSIWLPQNGFELWSVYYLQRKGMRLDQIKNFLRCFNAGVKEKMIHGGGKSISRELIDSIACCARFEGGVEPDMRPAEVYSGAGYREAERFWVEQFSSPWTTSNVEELSESGGTDDSGWASVPVLVGSDILEKVEAQHEAGLSRILLAAFAVMLSRVAGREDAVIVTHLPDEGARSACPVRTSASWDIGFRQFVRSTESRVTASLAHALYALNILSNPYRLAEYGVTPPVFGVGYSFASAPGSAATEGLQGELKYYPDVAGSMGLVLSVRREEGGARLRLEYASDLFRGEVIEKLAACFESIMAQVSDRPDALLEELTLGGEILDRAVAVKVDESEVFNF